MKPMLASIGDISILKNKDFIFEPKLDGFRALCFKEKKIKFLSRNNKDMTSIFPELKIFDNIDAKSSILDGEIVIYNKGKPDFQLMQNRKNSIEFPATFVVFDILEKNGEDLTNLSLIERKKILEKTIKENELIQINVFNEDGQRLWEAVKRLKLEGIIAKKKSSTYQQTRSKDWLKIKLTKTIDAIIIGFTKNKREISALVLGVYSKGRIIYIGKVGTGFDSKMIEDLKEKLEKIKTINPQAQTTEKNIIWTRPSFVAEIKYHELTRDKILRAPVFLRLREDKNPRDCIL